MKGRPFTEEQISGVLKEADTGARTKDLWRKHGISEATFALEDVTEQMRLQVLVDDGRKGRRAPLLARSAACQPGFG